MIESFDDLVRMAMAENDPPQLLTVLVKAEPMLARDGDGQERVLDGEGVLKPIMVKSRSVTEGLDFATLRAEADQADERWVFIMLAILPGHDGKPPSPADVDIHLKNMARALLTGGDLDRYLFIDRDGELVQISAINHAGIESGEP
jgi:hypothetical protein